MLPRFRIAHGINRGSELFRFSLLMTFVVTTAVSAAAFSIVRDGRATATIVIPDKPLPVVTAAADELQYHVREATGATLAIVPEASHPQGAVIYLGATKRAAAVGLDLTHLTPNGYIIRQRGDEFFLAGDDSDGPVFWILHNNRTRVGTLFAVYEFLDRKMGVRWLWPGKSGEVIPKVRDITVDEWDETGKPAFVHARWRDAGISVAGTAGWAAAADRSRFLDDQGKWLRRHRFALGVNMDIHHSFTAYWDEFGKSHPDYFNLLPDGTRRPDPTYFGGTPSLVSMNVATPELWKQIVEKWKQQRTSGEAFIDASEDDTPGKCTCPDCLAWDVPDPDLGFPFAERIERAKKAFAAGDRDWWKNLGSLSDRYARFYLAVQQEARKVDPDATVMGFAYANYVKPPLRTKLNDHIIIGIVPDLMYPWTAEKIKAFRVQWDGWGATGARLLLRPNYMLDGHDMPVIFAHKLGADFRYAARHGMIGTDFDSLTGQYATQGPNLYMLARLTARPDLTVEQVLDEYYGGFGKAAAAVRAYFSYWEKISDAVTDDFYTAAAKQKSAEGGTWARFYRVAPMIFTPAVMAHGRQLLDAAKAAAAGDATAVQRVEFLDKGLRNAELTLATQNAYEKYKQTGDLRVYADALHALDTFRADVEADGIDNMGFLNWTETSTWDRNLVKLMTEPGERLAIKWKFMWDPDKQGEKKDWFATDFDDAHWHDIRVDDPWEKQDIGRQWVAGHGRDFYGLAWYRTTFQVKPMATPHGPASSPKQVRLVFGAVDEACVIWVNGVKILERPYPYQGDTNSWQEAFDVDVTKVVHFDKPNVLAVRVENNLGDGGIWRPVWLVTTDAPVPAAENLIPDGGFEEVPGKWRQSVMCGKFTLAGDSTQAHSGSRSARITCTELAPPADESKFGTRAWARWYQTGIPVVAGKRYRLRVWIRTPVDFTGKIAVWAIPDAHDKTKQALALNTGGLWKEVVIPDFRPTASHADVYVNLMDSTGTVWIDDVELTQVE